MPVSPRATPAPSLASITGFPASHWFCAGGTLYLGDVREQLRRLPARSVHCVVTSPPYWGLRDYGNDKSMEIGVENTADCLGWATGAKCGECFVCHMVEVFSEVRRVLRDDGVLWLNLGDTIDGGDLAFVPQRVALAMQASGWVLRSSMPWVKRSAMPDSALNRPGRAIEEVFMFAKTSDYFFDMEAVRRPPLSNAGMGGAVLGKEGGDQVRGYDRSTDTLGRGWRNADLWFESVDTPHGVVGVGDDIVGFDVTSSSYKGAHFAVFPPALIAPMILAGTSEKGRCGGCGVPYRRITSDTEVARRVAEGGAYAQNPEATGTDHQNVGANSLREGIRTLVRETVGWYKPCACPTTEVRPCVVLDPFCGSGTTVATAIQHGRYGIGIDLSETYLRENAVPRIEAAMRGDKVGKKTAACVIPADVPPAPRVLR